MHMKLKYVILAFSLLAVSCSKRINLTGHYDPTQSFEVYHHEVGTYVYQVNEERHTKLISWLESNDKNWKPTRNDWGSLVIITQENFTLLLFIGDKFTVVTITDDENITRHYSKRCNNDGSHILDE